MNPENEGPTKVAIRTVRCDRCGYDVRAAFQNDDGSKARAKARDVYGAGSLGSAVGALAALLIQDLAEPHAAPCGFPCEPSDDFHPVGHHAGAFCPLCAHKSMACEQCQSLASSILDANTVWDEK